MRLPPRPAPPFRGRVEEVHGEHGSFVVRASPFGEPDGWGYFNNPARLLHYLLRWCQHDDRWLLRVRRWEDDPAGPLLAERTVPDPASVQSAMIAIKRELKYTGALGG